jgi:hypothetical protein
VLSSYPEIRDRIYELARVHEMRVDWTETTRTVRLVLLYDQTQIIIARAVVPVRAIRPSQLKDL